MEHEVPLSLHLYAAFPVPTLAKQPIPIQQPFPLLGIHREVADAQRGKILEKVGALGGRHHQVAETAFHNDAGTADLVPGNGNAQPGIAAAPAPNPHEDVPAPLLHQTAIQAPHFHGHLPAMTTLEAGDIHHHHIAHRVQTPGTQHAGAAAQQAGLLHFQIQLLQLLGQHHGAHLQHAEIHGFPRRGKEVHGELQFHRATHAPRSHAQHAREDFRQGKTLVFEHGGKADEARSRAA